MKKVSILALLLFWSLALQAAFTETYIDLRGTNINSGTTQSATPVYQSINGNWDGVSVFTPTDGSTPASTVSVGMFGSVFTNAVNTNWVYGGRITVVNAGVNGTITISTTAKMGTAPGLKAGVMELRVGGAWSGPYATVKFPFTTTGLNAYTNTSSDVLRINWRGGTNYIMTNAVSHAIAGPVRWQGYTTTAGDGGSATWDGNAAIASWVPLTVTAAGNDFGYLNWSSNGTSGSADGPTWASGHFFNLRVNNMRGNGMASAGTATISESLVYSNNISNTANRGGFEASAATTFDNCIATNNFGSNTEGIQIDSTGCTFNNCIFAFNGKDGIGGNSIGSIWLFNTECYSNTAAGLNCISATINGTVFAKNCNFLRNGTYGINNSGTRLKTGMVINCGFGSGTMANVSGDYNDPGGVEIVNKITYASGITPWVSPDTGNFNINLSAAYGTGRGTFNQATTLGYPSVGASPPAGFTNTIAATFAQ